jgi:hypothetical protein
MSSDRAVPCAAAFPAGSASAAASASIHVLENGRRVICGLSIGRG